jgi:glycine/D-amino acid oxidase-like deaminating enzyme/nitrite reductase/ring-hydroxylating ferredoxin subunit
MSSLPRTHTELSTEPLWAAGAPAPPTYPALSGDLEVDVAIVGGGVTGLTLATLLKDAGRSVAVLEMGRVAGGETERTTAHLTEVVDTPYGMLASRFGADGARLVRASSRAAIDLVQYLVARRPLACGFYRLPGWLYTETRDGVAALEAELDPARAAGARVRLSREVPLPFRTAGGLCFEQQAAIDPLCYLRPLAAALPGGRSRVCEDTRVLGVSDGEPCHVETEHGTVTARDVVVAANVPVTNRVLLHLKIAAYRSYVVAAPLRGAAPDGLFWDTAEPYHYARTAGHLGRAMLIVGGEDHKVGLRDDTEAAYRALEAYVRGRYQNAAAPAFRWSGQIIEPADGLPYIGRNPLSGHVHVATGFAGNGMTFGTLAAMIIADDLLGLANPYASLYDAGRVKPLAAARALVSENLDFPRERLMALFWSLGGSDDPVSLAPGDGVVVSAEGERVALCREQGGRLHALSPVCPHLGCEVRWNRAEQSWDCPCHGSRFAPDGRVLNGPAVTDLPEAPVARDRLSRSAR